ncbi:hypothetical protein ACAW74_10845 [Fibrella sp. WM1]|uniref:hypothetical protein n=1 Tax=Fibrella musci TaxID=3242485 RepID=UPI0035223D47
MRVPLSRQLTQCLLWPCMAFTLVALIDLWVGGQQRVYQNTVVLWLFGPPSLVFAGFLLNKTIVFKADKKVRKRDRLVRLPVSSFFMVSSMVAACFFLVGGLMLTFDATSRTNGLVLASVSLLGLVGAAVSLDHPCIWLSDTWNLDDLFEQVSNTPESELPAYQDGAFSYGDNAFTVQLEEETRQINWADITLIRAYKLDLYTVDCIVIEIHLSDSFVVINDQTAGHMKFMETVAARLPNVNRDWFMAVAFPAFELNLTIVYERQPADDRADDVVAETPTTHG